VIAAVKHPHVAVHDFGECSAGPYIALEHLASFQFLEGLRSCSPSRCSRGPQRDPGGPSVPLDGVKPIRIVPPLPTGRPEGVTQCHDAS
jgi:hypothetical protein